ncbi:MAG: hypothetical protein HY843_05685 [Bdellovibrio sp.]|nr:hypothetical protein [Bdellovibrio sp.]
MISFRSILVYLVPVFTVALMGIAQCNPGIKKICSVDFPQFKEKIELSKNSLERLSNSDRSVAARVPMKSIDHQYIELNADGRQQWIRWAEHELVEVQKLMDWISEESSFRDSYLDLSEIANHILYFHGYAKQGNTAKMNNVLEFIVKKIQKIQLETCSKTESL